jgi:hypothetical protein
MHPDQASRHCHCVPPCAHSRSLPSARALLQVVLGTALAACSAAPPDSARTQSEPATLWVEPARLDLRAGDEGAVQVQVNDRYGQPIGGAAVRLYAQDPRVLQVDPQGTVRALGPATAETLLIAQSGRVERRVPVSIAPGPLARLTKLDADPPSTAAGQALAAALRVRATDAWGNPLGGARLRTQLVGMPDRRVEVVTDDAGVAVVAQNAPSRAGHDLLLIQPTAAEEPRVSYTLEVSPAEPTDIRTALRAGVGRASLLLEVDVRDDYGNPVPSIEVAARVGSTRATPLAARTDAAGLARVPLASRKRTGALRVYVELPAFAGLRREISLPVPPPRARPNGARPAPQ